MKTLDVQSEDSYLDSVAETARQTFNDTYTADEVAPSTDKVLKK